MIVVLCTYQVNSEERDAWVEARREQVERTQQEHGCIEYRMTVDGFDPNTVVLVERWRDQDALDEHIKLVQANQAASTTPLPPTISRTATVFDATVLREL